MKTFRSINDIRKYIGKKKAEGAVIAFVPTMGYLHDGHLSLIRAAQRSADVVVVSIFVNPAQFGPGEDFKKYPRDIKRDERLAKGTGCDILFYPSAKSIYPDPYSTYVNVEGITDRLCGSNRPGHFRGVTTVVAKLFNIVRPDLALFGQKDAQQAIVIKRMVRDLNMDLIIRVMPTVREKDGLAMSSRNAYLSKSERDNAAVLYRSLALAKRMAARGIKDAKVIKREMRVLIKRSKGAKIDYISISDLDTLKEQKWIKKKALIALAVRLGKTRLIDNIIIGGRI